MNHASKTFSGSADGLITAKGKQQLTWVIIVTVCLLAAVRGGRYFSSLIWGEASPLPPSQLMQRRAKRTPLSSLLPSSRTRMPRAINRRSLCSSAKKRR